MSQVQATAHVQKVGHMRHAYMTTLFDLVELMSRTAKIDSVAAMSAVSSVGGDFAARICESTDVEVLEDIDRFILEKARTYPDDHAAPTWLRMHVTIDKRIAELNVRF